jgi:hypothetical protein
VDRRSFITIPFANPLRAALFRACQDDPMTDDADDFSPEHQLQRLEQEIADLEPSVQDAQRRIGNRDEGTGDQEDYAAAMTEVAEQKAVLDTLRERRDALREKLGR